MNNIYFFHYTRFRKKEILLQWIFKCLKLQAMEKFENVLKLLTKCPNASWATEADENFTVESSKMLPNFRALHCEKIKEKYYFCSPICPAICE